MIDVGVGYVGDSAPEVPDESGYVFGGTEIGYRLEIGGPYQFRLSFGLGLGGSLVNAPNADPVFGIALSPTVSFGQVYDKRWLFGLVIRAFLPAESAKLESSSQHGYRPLFTLSLDLGLLNGPTQLKGKIPTKASRSDCEWFRLSFPVFATTHSSGPGDWGGTFTDFAQGLIINGPRLKWRYFSWAPIEGGIFLTDYESDEAFSALFGGTNVGIPLLLGTKDKHELTVGMGIYYGFARFPNRDTSVLAGGQGIILCPMINYGYVMDSGLVVGGGFRAFLDAITDSRHFAAAFVMTLDLGYQ